MALLVLLAGGAGLGWLCVEGWRSDAVAEQGVWGTLVFAIAVLVFRLVAWLRTPREVSPADDSVLDLMTTPWWFGGWLRAPITIRLGDRERTTTLLGTTPIQTSLTWLALAALLAAWALAGHLDWAWVPDLARNRMEHRRQLREWIFGF